ncbi:OLC1v1027355C1 [Oldenlandia corymbosa var. corymbosa]|uniref:OLC1v1027355C1 n=1 Tax=Oldenlandia corymbosa var. corymbosa TaxID=529605 RepID=A0AAV1CB89_OLDCO|nr:OLC1v1027355C1 [Oldenlandia corymbosa var. corymbosa]
MDAVSLYFFTLIVILMVSLFIVFLNRRYSNNNQNVPPGSTGYLIIGETIGFSILGPEKFIAQRMKKYSAQVFKTSLFGEKMVVVCGPPGNKFAFFSGSDFILPFFPYPVAKLFDSLDSNGRLNRESYTKGRGFIHEILRYDVLKHYIPIVDSMAREYLNSDWLPFTGSHGLCFDAKICAFNGLQVTFRLRISW